MRTFLFLAAAVFVAALFTGNAFASEAVVEACTAADSMMAPGTKIPEALCTCVGDQVDNSENEALAENFIAAWEAAPDERRSLYTMEMGTVLASCAQVM